MPSSKIRWTTLFPTVVVMVLLLNHSCCYCTIAGLHSHGLSHRHGTKLLEHAKSIVVDPLLDDLAIGAVQEVNAADRDRPAGRRHAHKLAGVPAGNPHTHDDPIAIGKDIFQRV